MAAETLNFGPEWLRALSSGGSVASPPPSPAMPKYKLAEYRYGREEMLALYVKDNKVPEEIQDKEFSAILQDDPLQPLALVPLTEEEQRNFSMSVNSVAVLRLMGKGGGAAPAGVSRGRGSTRSRGRGRGESGFYQRSIEEAEGAFGRGGGGAAAREIHRSQSWDDRGERRFEKPVRREGARAPFEEGPPPGRKDFARSDSDNWRTLREEHTEEEEEGGGGGVSAAAGSGGSWRQSGGARRESERWRSASPDGGPRSAGWREHGGEGRRRKFDFDFRGHEEEPRSGRRHRHNSDSFEEDKDGLPEWCLEDEEEEMGTFDSSGAFMSLKKSPKESIPEEQELSFQALQEEEEEEEEEDRPEAKEGERRESGGDPVAPPAKEGAEREWKDPRLVPDEKLPAPPGAPWRSGPPFSTTTAPAAVDECDSAVLGGSSQAAEVSLLAASGNPDADASDAPPGDPGILSRPAQLSPVATSALPLPAASAAATMEFTVGDNEDEDGMKHLQQEAEKMVASLQDSSLEEEHFTQTIVEHRNTAAALPLSHEAAMKWFYKDPQGEIQGPFTTQEMAEWFQAGYFTMSLLVKRGCDEGFQPLGEVIKMWGRVPFAPGPSPPPLLGNMDQERLKKQQELAAAALYQQLQHQHLLQLTNRQQQYAQCALQQKVATGDLTPQQLTTFLQQLQSLKPRAGEQGMIPSLNRSISVPDTGSLWDTHTSASPQAGGEASLWDIPINSSTQGPILEQLQLQHKLQERRGAELRAKRDEDERKRRQEEQKRRQEEEELFRRKQLPSSSSWGQQSVNSTSSPQNSFSISDVQKLGDARVCRELRDECRQQELLLKLLQQQNPQLLWSGLAKQNLSSSMKALLELQQESDRHLQKQQQQQQQRAQQRAHGGHGLSSLPSQWGVDSSPLWGGHEKNSSISLWEESLKTSSPLARSLGLKNSRSSPSLGDTYGASCRQGRKKTDEEEKLLKLLQGIHKPQDGFTQWCEQMLHALNTSSTLDVPTVVAFLKEVESPYDVHDYIRSYLGDTLEAKEFAKQFLERRAKQRANHQRQQQQQEASWLSSSSLQSIFQANHNPKPPSFENSQAAKIKRRPMMLHADPSILGYALHGSSSELETVDDY
ncbi:GRB10-interacting GYF protein 1 isoform X2 [Hemicordylus capensis]|uniref:GRB10-interacting GYF protein 1 isoform X2 n=1 Tax=Hemicordylus capensis TaxID=884348 RepID=UPI0023036B43|nr:GRB10-interacting GYF protein 1 isoform X2 [Hemicordylus capensis]